jgi:1-acyl-sn-glycerol-3-phosphate acyltransferase
MNSYNETEQNDQDEEQQSGQLFKSKARRRGPAERMWAPIKLKLNKDYEYITKNLGLRFLYFFAMFIGMPFVFLVFKIQWGFRVIGRQNMKLIRKKAAVIVANHVHNLDSFMLMNPFFPNSAYVIALRHNFEAFIIGGLVRVMRGVPLPEEMQNFKRFSMQMNQMLQHTTKRLLFYPEGEILPYSRELRPFEKGAFYFAVKNDVPIMPMVFVFPKKKRIELIIGKPICIADVPEAAGLNESKKVNLFLQYTHNTMQQMMNDYYNACKGIVRG